MNASMGRGDQHRVGRFRVKEVTKLILAFLVIAGNAHDVAVVLFNQIGVFIDQRLAHTRGVVNAG